MGERDQQDHREAEQHGDEQRGRAALPGTRVHGVHPWQAPTSASLRERTLLRTERVRAESSAERPANVTTKLLTCRRGGQVVLPIAHGRSQRSARLASSTRGSTRKVVTT